MASQSAIDDRTLDIVRSAMTEVRAGRVPQALEIAERGLAEGADEGVLSAMLGTLRCETGDYSGAIEPLLVASRLRPEDRRIRFTLVSALLRTERYGEAVASLTDDVVNGDETMNFLRQRAYAAHMDGQLELAIADYRRFLATNSNDWESWNNLGNAYRNAEDLESAIEALRNAARINPGAAPTRLNLARALRDVGDLPGLKSSFARWRVTFPQTRSRSLISIMCFNL